MSQATPASPAWRQISTIIADFLLRVCVPLYWHDQDAGWPRTVRGGSSFVMRFPDRLVGVTAAHVVDIYYQEAAQVRRLTSQLGKIAFDLHEKVLDLDAEADIATFSVSQEEMARIGAPAFDCRTEWPPPVPQAGSPIGLIGFPEQLILPKEIASAEFPAYGALTIADDVSERDIIVTVDPTREVPLARSAALPPLGMNLSGCSGGPAVFHTFRSGMLVWHPVGIVIGGAGDRPEGAMQEFDIIRLRRINSIRSDGTIERRSSGWLPD